MMFGNQSGFAIQADIVNVTDGWVFGTFLFWINGKIVGNPEDKSVDLRGCLNWLKVFLASDVKRFEPGLYEMDKGQAYVQLVGSVILNDYQDIIFAEEKYSDSFERFHISHIGMSSFDSVTLLLIERDGAKQKLIWQQEGGIIEEAFLHAGEFKKVVEQAVAKLEKIICEVEHKC